MTDSDSTATAHQQPWHRIEELLGRRCEVCGVLVDLCGQQNALIEAEEPVDRLLAVLGRKQTLIDQLQCIEEELRPLKELWREKRDFVEAHRRERITDLAERAARVLKQALDMEEAGRSRLMGSRQGVVQELTHLDKGRQLVKAYGSPKRDEPRAIDLSTQVDVIVGGSVPTGTG